MGDDNSWQVADGLPKPVNSPNDAGPGFEASNNFEAAAMAGAHLYFNVFSADPLNATQPGSGLWRGPHASQTDVLTCLNAGTSSLAIAFGPLDPNGGAAASMASLATYLGGVTLYGVSIAIDAVPGQVVADSPIARQQL